jgi:cytochrome oxidase assembly protein ShyY1
MYRFLVTPKWLAFAALMVLLSAIMVALGCWQLHRYHERTAINARIDAAASGAPVPIGQVLTGQALTGQAPPAGAAWTRVRVTGVYDPANEILVRERTVNSQVGYEIVDPLRMSNGRVVLVDRGWLAAPVTRGALALPTVPAAPTGEVTVIGLVHLPESRPDTSTRIDGQLTVRRISPSKIATGLPYRVLGGYVVLDSQQPAADPAFVGIPVDHQDSGMNAGYVVQWWAFALITLAGFGWVARREAHPVVSDTELAGLETAEHPDAPISPAV